MKPKRIYQVYQDNHKQATTRTDEHGNEAITWHEAGDWRFRVLAPRAPVDHRIVGGSGESFASKGNALRAARREVSLYPAGVAAVEIAD